MQCEKQNTAEPTIILKTPTKHICSSEKHWQHKSYSIKKLAANQRHMVIHYKYTTAYCETYWKIKIITTPPLV